MLIFTVPQWGLLKSLPTKIILQISIPDVHPLKSEQNRLPNTTIQGNMHMYFMYVFQWNQLVCFFSFYVHVLGEKQAIKHLSLSVTTNNITAVIWSETWARSSQLFVIISFITDLQSILLSKMNHQSHFPKNLFKKESQNMFSLYKMINIQLLLSNIHGWTWFLSYSHWVFRPAGIAWLSYAYSCSVNKCIIIHSLWRSS